MPKPASLSALLRVSLFSVATIGALAIAGTVPALALDDGQESILSSVAGIVGLTKPITNDDIDYRERPPLVLPPKMQLRQPKKSSAAANPAWPNDPDVEARRAAAENAKRPIIPFTEKEAGLSYTKERLMKDRVAAQKSAGPNTAECVTEGKNCNHWNPHEGGALPAAPDQLVAGEEPVRGSLTEPPKGYRVATKTVKATTEPPRAADDDSARSFYRKKPKTDE